VYTETRRDARVLVVRPHPRMFTQWVTAILALCTPIFAVLYWLTLSAGGWLPVLIVQLALTAVFGLGVLAYYLVTIWVTPLGITKRDHYGRVHAFPSARIGRIIRVDLYRSTSLDLQPQLFVVDNDGSLITRMHGICWSASSMDAVMDAVMDALGTPVVRIAEPMTLVECNREYPGLLHWFERRPAPREAMEAMEAGE
jgi:hypothetical protein